MSKPPYIVTVDREQLLVRMTLYGLWDLAVFDGYTAAARQAFAQLAATGEPQSAYRILIDLRQHGVQPREVAEQIQAELRSGLSLGSRHAALVSESTLHKMQVQRIGTLINASFFTDETEAMTWLFSNGPTSPPVDQPDVS